MRVLVTGGAGFIGRAVCKYLLSAGNAVSVIDDFSLTSANNIEMLPVDLYRGNILDDDRLSAAMAGASSVIHLAASVSVHRSMIDPRHSVEVNTLGTLKVLEHARQRRAHVTFASTAAVYGQSDFSDRSNPRPVSPYGGSKLAAEVLCQTWRRSFDVPMAILRIFNCYGPGQRLQDTPAPIIPTLIHAALTGDVVRISGTGNQTRCFVYRDTVAKCLGLAAIGRIDRLDPIDVAPHPPVSIMDVVSEIRAITNRPLRIEFDDARPGDILHSKGDAHAFRCVFGDLTATPLRIGLRDTVNWLRRRPDKVHLP